MTRTATAESPPTLDYASSPRERYRVGTLAYTSAGLVTLFLWILWGDFCYTLMGFIKPNILPLMLKENGASNRMIAVISVSTPNLMTMLIAPVISTWSDRFRSRWGRRIPFLFIGTPFLAFFLVLLGFSEPIARWLGPVVQNAGAGISPRALTLATFGFFVIASQFFELLVASAYYALINDVVPEAILGRFLALFNIVSRAANFIFCMFVLGNALTHTRAIFIGISVMYLVSFLLICWRVREGEYPPPPRVSNTGRGGLMATYVRQCFGQWYYVCFFLGVTFYGVAGTVGMFQVFFVQTIGLSLEQYGQVAAWTGLPVLLLMYPAGALVDRIHPLRAILLCLLGYNLSNVAMLLAVHGVFSYALVQSFGVILTAVFNVAFMPLYMKLLPKDRYGQFASAAAVLGSLSMIIFPPLAGAFMDWAGNYRLMFLWSLVFQSLSFLFLYLVYRQWRFRGDTRDDVAAAAPPPQPQPA